MRASNTPPFASWEAELGAWIDDIDYPRNLLGDFRLEPKYADPPSPTIEFGAFKGRPNWRTLADVPTQPARDALLNLVTVQGDTEFASVEQQRHLVESAPTAYDRKSLVRVNAEEMRHGLQMAHILVTHFGESGAIEARKLLARRATRGNRLLKAFNDPVRHWLDFFCYTAFMDRDGKYQLTMLQRSAFHPLAASMGPMLKEEAFHLGTGVTGLKRILQADVIPTPVLQKYVNWWISAAYDCFGKEESGAAAWAYEWGLKGRFDESEISVPPERDAINDHNRALYAAEVDGILTNLNAFGQKGQPPLTTPSLRFHRRVGKHEDQPYSTSGDLLGRADHEAHLLQALPTSVDEEKLREWFKEGWLAHARRPDTFRVSVFFECLPEAVAEEIRGPVGAAYDRVLYATSMPIAQADVVRSLGFAGFEKHLPSLPREGDLRGLLDGNPYPQLATLVPRSVASGAWSSILHFHDPSYPLDSPDARRGLAHLGYKIAERDPYAIYVAAVDDLKDRAPACAVPETHWFLSRLIQVGLERWGRGVVPGEHKRSRMAPRR